MCSSDQGIPRSCIAESCVQLCLDIVCLSTGRWARSCRRLVLKPCTPSFCRSPYLSREGSSEMFSFVGTLSTYIEQPISSANVLSTNLMRCKVGVLRLLTICCGLLLCGQMLWRYLPMRAANCSDIPGKPSFHTFPHSILSNGVVRVDNHPSATQAVPEG